MKKAHNKNISKVDTHFQHKMLDLQSKIEKLQMQCDDKKKTLAKLNEDLNFTTGYCTDLLMETIHDTLNNYTSLKIKRNKLVEEYKEVKKMYNTIKRAIEERWQDGFNEGVQFMTDTTIWTIKNAYKKISNENNRK